MSDKPKKRSTGERLGFAALLLVVGQLLSRILGMVRESVIGILHGSGLETDAYEFAFQLPEYLSYLLAGGTLSITFIPLFSEYLNNDEEAEGWRLFSTIATVTTVILVTSIVVLELYTPELVSTIVAPGIESQEKLDLTVSMTRILLPAQIGFVIGGLLQATLYVREVFWPSAVTPLIYNICIISGGIFLEPWFGIQGFAIGALVGAILGPFGLTLWAARKHVAYRPRLDIKHPGFKRFVIMAIPLMLGVSLVRVDQWIIQILGSYHEHGAVTWLKRARKLMMVFFAMIGQAVGQAALPFLANLLQQGKEEKMGNLLARNIQRAGFLAILATAGLVVIARPATYLILQYGEFTPYDADMTGFFLILFAVGLVGWVSQSIAVRGFYAREDTWTPMLISTVTVGISIAIYWTLNQTFGPAGLAAATSIGMTMTAIATIGVYKYKYEPLPLEEIGKGLFRGLSFAIASGGIAFLIRTQIEPHIELTNKIHNLGMLLVMGLGFFGTAGLLALIFKPPETEYVMRRLTQKLSSKK